MLIIEIGAPTPLKGELLISVVIQGFEPPNPLKGELLINVGFEPPAPLKGELFNSAPPLGGWGA
ncbi:hypothetical protein A0256_22050 [Mucilaginibacter sp. PAMC 26640]|nr:hypothetical protein A0256_22050 [Mucilaginibacter sp. PAMC 26640]